MKIECLLKREGGSKIDLGDEIYHFEPNAEGVHVAEVTNEDHIATLLAIEEGYKEFGVEKTKTPDKTPVITTLILKGSDWEPVEVEYGEGNKITTAELVSIAFKKSGISEEEWNEAEDEDIENAISATLLELDTPQEEDKTPVQQPEPENKLTRAEKKAALEAKKLELGQR